MVHIPGVPQVKLIRISSFHPHYDGRCVILHAALYHTNSLQVHGQSAQGERTQTAPPYNGAGLSFRDGRPRRRDVADARNPDGMVVEWQGMAVSEALDLGSRSLDSSLGLGH